MKISLKQTVLMFLIFVLGLGGGLAFGLMFERLSYSEELSVSHMCSCIGDSPEYQKKALAAANEVNELIKEETEEFINKNDLIGGDFDAAFIPQGNRNYCIKVWCSNRNDQVHDLFGEYKKTVEGCLAPHKLALGKAHDESILSNSLLEDRTRI